MNIRGIRGAITVKKNSSQEIVNATKLMMLEIFHRNRLEPEQVISAVFSVTHDLDATFPTQAVRDLGWSFPMLNTLEIPVPNSLPFCIRVLLHVETQASIEQIFHVYLRDAVSLRPDLVKCHTSNDE